MWRYAAHKSKRQQGRSKFGYSVSNNIDRRRFYCEPCGKWAYASKRAARKAARAVHPEDGHLTAYKCRAILNSWHFGHDYIRYEKSKGE